MISDYLRTGAFFTITILLIINFVFLFKKNTSYISWIFGFVLFVLYPFTWIEELLKHSKYINSSATDTKVLYWGTIVSILIAIILEITTLIIVIMTNDYFRKKNGDEKKDEPDEPEKENAKNENKMIDQNTSNVKIMFVTTVALIMGMVINLFIVLSKTSSNDTELSRLKTGDSINQIVNFIPSKIDEFEKAWIGTLNLIRAPQLLKAFFLFCGGFLIPFFTIFVKVSKDTLHYDVFFPPVFHTDIKSPVYFVFLALMLSSAVTFLATWLAYTVIPFISSQSTLVNFCAKITGIVSFILCNVLFNIEYPPKKYVMEYIYILISFCFAVLATPITFGVLDLFARLFNKSLVYDENKIRNTANVILFSIFVSYWLGIFLGGKAWITDLNNKKLRMIIVTIICMTIGMFFAFSSYYEVFTNLLSVILFFVRTTVKYLGPPAIISLTASQIYLANKSFHHKNRTTDDFN